MPADALDAAPAGKRALITGITGQDGSYLAELLLQKGYSVYGLARRESWSQPHCASHLAAEIEVIFGDIAADGDISRAVEIAAPTEIYNLASQSSPGESWRRGAETLAVNGLGAVRLFEIARHHDPSCRIYQASSSEMFGAETSGALDEETPLRPVSPYGLSKAYAHHAAAMFRANFGTFVSCGILFNHESERRRIRFLTQKVAHGAACAALGIAESPLVNECGRPIVAAGKLSLGNLSIARDWGYAPDFARAMWLILQHGVAEDFVIGTGVLHGLDELCQIAYGAVGCDWRRYVVSDPDLMRPSEIGHAVANPAKAARLLGWQPAVTFEEMIGRMVQNQIDSLMRDRSPEEDVTAAATGFTSPFRIPARPNDGPLARRGPVGGRPEASGTWPRS